MSTLGPLLLHDPKKINNTSQIVNPTVTDDKSQGHAVGCKWFNSVTGELFSCTDNTVGAAVWKAVVPLGGLLTLGFTGRASAGAITLTGALLGKPVVAIWEATGATLNAAALFEATVSVAGQLQQISGTDLSAKKYIVQLGT